MTVERKKHNFMKYITQKINKTNMQNQITQKFIDLLGPITEDRLHFGQLGNKAVAGGHNVVEMSKVQRELTEQLLKDHFKLQEINWMALPSGIDKNGKPIVAKTHRLLDTDILYEGKTGYVYVIFFSPKMYDPKTIHDAIKDGCTITPTFYNPETFAPYKKIVLTWSPEQAQDFPFTNSEEVMKQTLRDQLEKVLENPDEYMPEAFRGCMVRMAVV
jgi:hypothetical protein